MKVVVRNGKHSLLYTEAVYTALSNNQFSNRAADYIVRSAKQNAPYWSGFLRNSIQKKVNKKNEVVVVADAPYAGMVETGFAPHFLDLEASTGSGYTVADWVNSKGAMRGVYFFGNKPYLHVTHAGKAPARTGSKFMEKALTNFQSQSKRIYEEELAKITKGGTTTVTVGP